MTKSPSSPLTQQSPSRGDDAVNLREIEDAIIDFFKHTGDLLGVPHSLASIYGLFFATTTPLSLQDVAERLNLSQGSCSNGLRFLKVLGAIRVVEGPEIRRDYFIIDLEIKCLIRSYLDNRVQTHLAQGSSKLEDIKSQLVAFSATANSSTVNPAAESAVIAERLSQLEAWHSKMQSLLPALKLMLAIG